MAGNRIDHIAHGNPGVGFQELVRYNDNMLTHMGPGEKVAPAVEPYIPSEDPKLQDKGAYKVTGLAKKWIEDNIRGTRKNFFMFINYMEPHGPYRPPRFERPTERS